MKFAALNKEASSSSVLSTPSGKKGRPTIEAQESACLELYHSAIQFQQNGHFSQASDIYRQILESEVMEEACQVGGASQNTTLSKLKYLVYKNMAAIARERGDLSAAVDAYIEASTIDTTDVTMWCQLASAASLLGNLLLARKALECALECNDGHWPALESLVTVLFALEDYHSCLVIIKKGFELDSNFSRGLVYLHHISERCPDLLSYDLVLLKLHLMKPPPPGEVFLTEAAVMQERRKALMGVIVLREDIVPAKRITTLTIYNLASCLLSLYKQCKELSQVKASYVVKIDSSSLLSVLDEPPSTHSSPAKKPVSVQLSVGGESPKQSEVGGAGSSGEEGGGRSAKRRLLEELETFAPKRRSSRVKAKGPTPLLQQGQSHFDMLSKFIPSFLRMPDLPDPTEFSPLKKTSDEAHRQIAEEQKRQLSALSDSAQCLNESEVVSDFVKKSSENCGILDLLTRFLIFLSLRYDHKWSAAPFPVLKLFTELYECLHPHLTLPSLYSSMEDIQQPSFKNMAMVALCYIESFIDCKRSSTRRGGVVDSCGAAASLTPPKSFTQCLYFAKQCAGLVGAGEREKVLYALRVVWSQAKWAVICADNLKAASLLEQCERMLKAHCQVLGNSEKTTAVCLPNFREGQIISLDHVHELTKQLEQCVSVNELHDLYKCCNYKLVVEKLLPLFDENPEPPMELLVGREKAPANEKSSLSLLLSSLLRLDHYHTCLQKALQAALHLHTHSNPGNERWAAALKEVLMIIEECLPPVICEENSERGSDKKAIIKAQSDEKDPQSASKDSQTVDEGLDVVMNEQGIQNECISPQRGGQTRSREHKREIDGASLKIGTNSSDVQISSSDREVASCSREDLLTLCDVRLLKRLVTCVIKTMDLATDMADSPVFHCLPVAVTWRIFYTLIASNWRAAEEAVSVSPLPESTAENTLPQLPTLVAMETQPLELKESTVSSENSLSPSPLHCGPVCSAPVMTTTIVSSTSVVTAASQPATCQSDTPVLSSLSNAAASVFTADSPLLSALPVATSAATQPPVSLTSTVAPMTSSCETSLVAGGDRHSTITDTSEHSLTPSIVTMVTTPPPTSSQTAFQTVSSSPPTHHTPLATPTQRDSLSPTSDLTPSKSSNTDGLPLTLEFLIEAHHHIGRLGWCCKEEGSFLKLSVSKLRSELKQLLRLPTKLRETLLVELEQCYYCLYGHPEKKAKTRGLEEHNSSKVPLTWDSALMLIEYFHPSSLPSIDDSKSPQVTAELLSLYKRIVSILPSYGKVISLLDLNGLIDGTSTESMVVRLSPHQHSTTIAEIHYLLADDALKAGYNHNAIQCYLQSLCYCPDQFDAWAGLALAHSWKIIEKINKRDLKTGMEKFIQRLTPATVKCFEKAVSLNDKHCYVMEKFGFFCYTIQSFCSQILEQPKLFVIKDIHSWASDSLGEMLLLSRKCFKQALSLRGSKHSEPWLYQFMLGKIGRKLSQPFEDTLKLFISSAECLHSDGAAHPNLVELSAKYHALEVIEVYYQLHTFILKSLLREGKHASQREGDRERLGVIEQCLRDLAPRLESLPLGRASYPSVWRWVSSLLDEAFERRGGSKDEQKKSVREMEQLVALPHTAPVSLPPTVVPPTVTPPTELRDSPGSSDQSSHTTVQATSMHSAVVVADPPMTSENVLTKTTLGTVDAELLKKSLYGVAVCAIRCPAYFKSLYRMAAMCFEFGLGRVSKEILLGPVPSALLDQQEKLVPLFILKPNIFSNMWQIPSEEINRPGNFSTHARRNLDLLLEILLTLSDVHSLSYLAHHLRHKPDTTKQYMRDSERGLMFKKAARYAVLAMKATVSDLSALSQEELGKLQSIATNLKPIAKTDSTHELTKEIERAIELLKAAIVPAPREKLSVESMDVGSLAVESSESMAGDRTTTSVPTVSTLSPDQSRPVNTLPCDQPSTKEEIVLANALETGGETMVMTTPLKDTGPMPRDNEPSTMEAEHSRQVLPRLDNEKQLTDYKTLQ